MRRGGPGCCSLLLALLESLCKASRLYKVPNWSPGFVIPAEGLTVSVLSVHVLNKTNVYILCCDLVITVEHLMDSACVLVQVLLDPDSSPFIRLMPIPITCPKPIPGVCHMHLQTVIRIH